MLKVKNLTKSYDGNKVLDDVSFSVKKGEIIAVIGCSGSGKSTILRCLNHLEEPDSGEILYNEYKNIGTVFQSFNLFPHKTIFENITYAPLTVMGKDFTKTKQKCETLLSDFGLEGISHKYPADISGGQKQRVAIIRTLMIDPDIILFDEPTSALDPENVKEVLEAMKKLADQHITMLIVTHEMKFAKNVSNKILFIDHGKVIEFTESKKFFKNPGSERAKKFLEMIT